MSHLKTIAPEEIVEIGCGGGINAGELLKRYPSSHVTAIDYSEVSVSKATEYNSEAIKRGRCEVKQGDVSALTLRIPLWEQKNDHLSSRGICNMPEEGLT